MATVPTAEPRPQEEDVKDHVKKAWEEVKIDLTGEGDDDEQMQDDEDVTMKSPEQEPQPEEETMIKHQRKMISTTREETLENKMKSMNISMRNGNRPMRMMMKRQRAVKSTSRNTRPVKRMMQWLSTPHG